MLEQWRQDIDRIDNQLIALLKQRFKLSEAIGTYKIQVNQPVFSPIREAEQQQRWLEQLSDPKDQNDILVLLREVVSASRRRQENILKGEREDEESIL